MKYDHIYPSPLPPTPPILPQHTPSQLINFICVYVYISIHACVCVCVCVCVRCTSVHMWKPAGSSGFLGATVMGVCWMPALLEDAGI